MTRAFLGAAIALIGASTAQAMDAGLCRIAASPLKAWRESSRANLNQPRPDSGMPGM
jgi:hypothetical protein